MKGEGYKAILDHDTKNKQVGYVPYTIYLTIISIGFSKTNLTSAIESKVMTRKRGTDQNYLMQTVRFPIYLISHSLHHMYMSSSSHGSFHSIHNTLKIYNPLENVPLEMLR